MWNRLPKKSRDLSKYLVFSLLICLFSFPNSVTAHHFHRINDNQLSNLINRNSSATTVDMVYTVDMIYTVDMVYTVDTVTTVTNISVMT